MPNYSIYCDESCHLENDHQKAMVIGALWCPAENRFNFFKRIREIKKHHNLSEKFEIKWNKVSPAKLDFYLDLIDYFFDKDDLHFRALIVPNKNILQHEKHNQTHDEWYYKMYFSMIKTILSPSDEYDIYLDIKDTKGGEKVRKLHEVLCNTLYDFSQKIIKKIQIIESHDVELMQIADLLIGALSYLHRGLEKSTAKEAIIQRIRARSGYSLVKNTLLREEKINLLIWQPNDTSK